MLATKIAFNELKSDTMQYQNRVSPKSYYIEVVYIIKQFVHPASSRAQHGGGASKKTVLMPRPIQTDVTVIELGNVQTQS